MILIIDLNEKEPLSYLEFVKPIEDILKKENKKFKTKNYKDISKRDIEKSNKIILTGTSLKNNEYLKHDFSWIKNYKKPLLGICAGMQVIALSFNAKLKKSQEIGLTTLKKNNLNIYKVYSLHNYSVTLPKNFKKILESEKSIQGIKKNNIIAYLFHPEVLNKSLIADFVK